MTHQILIVDSNTAFATMLQESLEQGGEYRATMATSGDEALQALTAADFDLAIVDLGLSDPDGATLARALRQQRPDLRLMLIPLVGEEPPPELADLDVQGTLPKPFFLPELPGRIADALARPVGGGLSVAEAVSMEPEPPPRPAGCAARACPRDRPGDDCTIPGDQRRRGDPDPWGGADRARGPALGRGGGGPGACRRRKLAHLGPCGADTGSKTTAL
ncbi:MAG: hypothetical protein DRI80_03435 [Chloroflexota bacterium]|nr:MAG: hypothetical protein DRI80_03435 [Chloroflexota bacterium]